MQKKIILFGAFIILLGILWPYLKKIGLGSLPGDIKIMKENYSFFFPNYHLHFGFSFLKYSFLVI